MTSILTRRGARAPRLMAYAGLGLAMMTACQQNDAVPRPPSVPIAHVSMREYRFDHDSVLPGGRVVFRLENVGSVDHAPSLVRLPDDFPLPVRDLVSSDSRYTFPTTARVLRRRPGANGVFAVDLRPGRYALFCFLTDPDGELHFDRGMASEFEVK